MVVLTGLARMSLTFADQSMSSLAEARSRQSPKFKSVARLPLTGTAFLRLFKPLPATVAMPSVVSQNPLLLSCTAVF